MSSGRSAMSNVGGSAAEVGLQRDRLVAAEHEAAALVPHVDVGVDHAGDRELGPHAGDRLGDQQLMARRHHRQRSAQLARRPGAPTARRVHHRAASRWCRGASARPRHRAGRCRSRWPACAAATPLRASPRPGNSRSAARTARRCSRSGSTSRRRCRARRGSAGAGAPRRRRRNRSRHRRCRPARPRGPAARRRARCARSSARRSG